MKRFAILFCMYIASLFFCVTLNTKPRINRSLRKKVTLTSRKFTPRKDDRIHRTISIWVHGTRFSYQPVFRTVFENKAGLKPAVDIDSSYHLRDVANILHKASPEVFPLDDFYIFGWSGKLSEQERKQAARSLYKQLVTLLDTYKNMYGTQPTVRFISHSHGGNLVLYLAEINTEFNKLDSIEELILLACPVQDKTVLFTQNPFFKKVYAMYSSLDIVQPLAPQIISKNITTKKGAVRAEFKFPPVSKRSFPEHPNLAQVKIKMNGRAIFHSEFAGKRFLSALPHIVHLINTWKREDEVPPIDQNTPLLCLYTRKGYENTAPSVC